MNKPSPKTTITIARQLGSGGSYIGRLLAERLGFKYVDREVLRLAAQELRCDERELAAHAERVSSFWERVFRGFTLGAPDGPYSPPPPLPTITARTSSAKQTTILNERTRGHDYVIVGWS